MTQSPGGGAVLVFVVQAGAFLRPRLSPETIDFLTSFGDTLVDRGELEQARRLYDALFRLRPDRIELYLRQYDALGGRRYLQGYREEAVHYWVLGRQKQDRLAREHGLLPRTVTYLAPEWSMYYGHLGLIAFYIKKNLLADRPQKLVVLARRGQIGNQALLDHYAHWVEIDDSPETASRLPAILLREGLSVFASESGGYRYLIEDYLEVERRWRDRGNPPLLRLSDELKEAGRKLLAQLGVDPDGWFVCLHVRDGTREGDRYSRNAELETYAAAVQTIARAGGRVIRVGPKLEQPPAMAHLVDYASSPCRSEWGDVFLNAGCRFFLGMNSGPCLIPEIFGVPAMLTNWHPFGEGPLGGLYIPKLLWQEKEQRYLTFAEMLRPPFAITERQAILRQNQVRLVDNTPEELCSLAEEMLERLEGKTYTPEEEEDQVRFQEIMKRFQPGFQARIGAAFLKKHRELLAV